MRPSITLVNRGIPTPESDPQCPWLLQRIDELVEELAVETEPARARHWSGQLRVVVDRARCLGCLGCAARKEPVLRRADSGGTGIVVVRPKDLH